MGETIGTMQQDRATAIAGTLGKGPALVPMTVTLRSRAGARRRDAAQADVHAITSFNDQMFTPLLAYVAMFNTLASYERQFGAATFAIKSRAKLKGHGDLSARGRVHRRLADARRVGRDRRTADDAARQRHRADRRSRALESR